MGGNFWHSTAQKGGRGAISKKASKEASDFSLHSDSAVCAVHSEAVSAVVDGKNQGRTQVAGRSRRPRAEPQPGMSPTQLAEACNLLARYSFH